MPLSSIAEGNEGKTNSGEWWNGKAYRTSSQAQFDLALSFLQQYAFKGTEQVLDLGCGSGRITAWIAKEKVPYGSVTGLDLSRSMIDEAQNFFQETARKLKFVVGIVSSFHFNEIFDVIVSFSALHWVSDQSAVWKLIHRHLKKGGKTIISLNPLPRHRPLTQAIYETDEDRKWASYFRGYMEPKPDEEITIDEYRIRALA